MSPRTAFWDTERLCLQKEKEEEEKTTKSWRKDRKVFGCGGKGAMTHPMSSFPYWETEAQEKEC